MSDGHPSGGKPRARLPGPPGLARLRAWFGRLRGRVSAPGPAAAAPDFAVLMVCMGNLCRSPTAEAVLRHKLQRAGLGDRVLVRSAGTHADGFENRPPDPRAIAAGRRRGYDLSAQRARTLRDADFGAHDLILAMDDDNFEVMTRRCPTAFRQRLGTLASHGQIGVNAIPDPYYGAPEGFERVLDLVEDACDGLTEYLVRHVHAR